ncbi:MAG: GNAT family N-acetyltransferase [Alteromonadaceae bacterium]|nr:GNAT family N-acetyltransferase [Alteromonadaceae bacterium]
MQISLREINKSNYEAVCDLDVTEQQEDYVACNMWSLVESFYNSGHTCKAIYCNDEPVGFFMWVQESPSKVSIWRFMVDKNYQNKGIGRLAMAQAIEVIKQTPDLEEIEICYNPENPVAKEFYSGFGFQEVGMDDDEEDMLAVIRLCPNKSDHGS